MITVNLPKCSTPLLGVDFFSFTLLHPKCKGMSLMCLSDVDAPSWFVEGLSKEVA